MKRTFKTLAQMGDNAITFSIMAIFIGAVVAGYVRYLFFL